MTTPHTLANAAGSFPDADKYMDNFNFLESLVGGNLAGDPGLENWGAGTSFAAIATEAPINDFWYFQKGGTSGPTVTASRESSIVHSGTYALKVDITVAGSADSYARMRQEIKDATKIAGQTVIFGAMVYAGTANKVRLALKLDGTTHYSSAHSGAAGWEKLTVQQTIGSGITSVSVWVEASAADFTGAYYLDSSFLYIVPPLISAISAEQLSFSGRVMRHLTSIDTYVGDKDAFTYILGRLFGGGNGALVTFKTQTTTGVTTSAATILSGVGTYGCYAFVVGDNGTDFFADIVICSYGGTPQVVTSKTMTGSPAARTYTNPGSGVQQLEMGSGTYDIQLFGIELSGR